MITTIAVFAALAAAPVQVDLTALKAGHLPAAGTLAEADSCATQATYMFMGLSLSESLSVTDKNTQLRDPMKSWVTRAAALRGVTSQTYTNDSAVVMATISLADIPADGHFDLHKQCRERLTTTQ